MYSRLIFLALQTLKANIKWLEDCCTYIESLPKQRQVCFLSKPTCGALRITLHSTVALIDRLLKSGFRYVLVGNLGQDPLEVIQVLFGTVCWYRYLSFSLSSASLG